MAAVGGPWSVREAKDQAPRTKDHAKRIKSLVRGPWSVRETKGQAPRTNQRAPQRERFGGGRVSSVALSFRIILEMLSLNAIRLSNSETDRYVLPAAA